jgi:hypothetical protein
VWIGPQPGLPQPTGARSPADSLGEAWSFPPGDSSGRRAVDAADSAK